MKTLLRILIVAGVCMVALGAVKQQAFDGPFPPPCLPPAVCQR